MKKRRKLWVVDLGEALTKVVAGVIDDSGRVQIEAIRIEKTTLKFRPGAGAAKKTEALKFLRALLKGYRRKDEVVLLINDKKMMVVALTFPIMKMAEVKEAIFWQLQLLTSENLEDWQIDFVAREQNRWFECLGVNEKKLEVLGVAVERKVLSWYARIFKSSGCALKSIIPQFYTFDSLINQEGDGATLIIDMGKKCTRFFYYKGGTLSEHSRVDLDEQWDGETYLQKIIRAAEQFFLFPLGYEKAGDNGNIYLMGGESLHGGVLEYLKNGLNREIRPIHCLLDESKELAFPGQISRVELSLIAPCLSGLLKNAQITGRGGF